LREVDLEYALLGRLVRLAVLSFTGIVEDDDPEEDVSDQSLALADLIRLAFVLGRVSLLTERIKERT
jgi:hypothetical protein